PPPPPANEPEVRIPKSSPSSNSRRAKYSPPPQQNQSRTYETKPRYDSNLLNPFAEPVNKKEYSTRVIPPSRDRVDLEETNQSDIVNPDAEQINNNFSAPVSSTLELQSREKSSLVDTADPSFKSGWLIVSSEPTAAIVSFNHMELGKTPLEAQHLPTGRNIIEIEKDGYEPFRETIYLQPGRRTKLHVTLDPINASQFIQKYGKLEVTSEPDNAEVRFNGSFLGNTPLSRNDVGLGRGYLVVSKEGFQTQDRTIQLGFEDTAVEHFYLPAWTGTLIVSANLTGAQIFLDGKFLAEYRGSELIFSNIKTGMHEVRGVYEGLSDAVHYVKVDAGRTHNIFLQIGGDNQRDSTPIKNNFAQLYIDSSPSGGLVYLDQISTGQRTPAHLPNMLPGRYLVGVYIEGYGFAQRYVYLAPNSHENVYLSPQTIADFYSSPRMESGGGLYFYQNGMYNQNYTSHRTNVAEQIITWQKQYDRGGLETAVDVIATRDGGFVFGGYQEIGSERDALLVKIDQYGEVIWSRVFEARGWEKITSIAQTEEGGFVFTGLTKTDELSESNGWFVRVDHAGNVLWSRTYGSDQEDILRKVNVLPDGEFLLTGESSSGGSGKTDGWVLQVSDQGFVNWQRFYGSTEADGFYDSVRDYETQTITLVGYTTSPSTLNQDGWIVSIDQNHGNQNWETRHGGRFADELIKIRRSDYEGFVALGQSNIEEVEEDSTEMNIPKETWLVRTDEKGLENWSHIYGAQNEMVATDFRQTEDGGFIISGITEPNTDYADGLLMKVDALGEIEWNRRFGGNGEDALYAICHTHDRGFILAGFSSSDSSWPGDIWIIKTSPSGLIYSEAHEEAEESGGINILDVLGVTKAVYDILR
ncbi:PEGA domain-containing protein, partial [bacterium]|nr:PEGA domain-containing protein [bacterium]